MALRGPRGKRPHTESDISENRPYPEFVAFEDYKVLHEYVVKLKKHINELQICLMESCAGKVSDRLSNACPLLQDPPTIGLPSILQTDDNVFPVLPSQPNANSKNTYAGVASKGLPKEFSSLAIAKEAVKIMDKATRAVIERMPDDKEDPEQEKKD